MIDNIEVLIDGEPHKIDLRRLNLLFHDGNANIMITDPRVIEINPIQTVGITRAMPDDMYEYLRQSAEANRLFAMVMKVNIPERDKANQAHMHVLGLIVMMVGAIKDGLVPFLRLPESYLHPGQQTGLADLLLELTKD